MSALAGSRSSTPTLPLHPNVLLSGSERIMEGPFGIISQSLLSLGSCPIENLAHSPKADLEGFDLLYVSSDLDLPPGSSQPPSDLGPVVSDDKESQKASSSMQFVAQLHQTCVGAFGNSEALKFEFLEEPGREDKKQCILTITRPNGQTRSYTTEREFSRKSDAKARAATIAIEMGAVDFILHGNKDASYSRSKLILAPLDSTMANKPEIKAKEDSTEEIEDDASKQIEALCVEWRASQVQPRWVFFQEHKMSPSWGCVLVVELSLHSQCLYSVDTTHNSQPLAKKACSEAAVRQGIVDFIKYGNCQTAPAPTVMDPLNSALLKREPDIDRKGRTAAISLQAFFDSLPKPFPEPVADKTVANLNAPGMLNTTLQLAKGARLSLQFFFLNDNGLHGSIIRLHRPQETKTYMVDTKFSKRSDAKAAVCLQAMSQGISEYIRSLAAAVDNKVTPEMRKRVNEQILPILGSEYGKLRHGMHPAYDYDHDQGAFSCTMTLSLSADPKPEETKSWSVRPEYRTKTDAKIAVVFAAGVEAIEFVRFCGEPPPPDHDPFKPYRRKEQPQDAQKSKRENSVEQRSNGVPKRPLTASGLVRLGLPMTPLLETKEEAKARQMAASRWQHAELSPPRPPRHPSSYSRGPPQPPPPVSGPSRQYEPLRKGPPFSRSSYEVSAAADAAIGRVTGPSAMPTSPAQPPRPILQHTQRHPPPAPQPQNYFQTAAAQLRPPRKSQLRLQPSQHSLPSQHPPFAASQSPQQNTPRPTSRQFPPAAHQSSQPTPSQPSLQSQHFTPYGAVPQPQQTVPQHPSPYPSGPYPVGYVQQPYPYPMQQGAQYPPPINGFPFPVAPPAYGVPAYPAYAAYYADPRYAQYAHYAQYSMPGAPMPYAVPVPPAPGMQQHTTPPPPAPGQITTATNPAQLSTSLPTPSPTASVDEPASAPGPEIAVSPTRTASFSAASDRQKRPRSRDMSMSPEDAQLHKKHRSESSLPQSSVKRESVSASPAPPTPVSSSNDRASSVEQLLRYCESESLSWPEFGSKQMKNEHGEDVFKVWIVMGKERLELPIAFLSENEGRQRVAKQVLQRLRSRSAGK